jgi:hypothetical protein
MARTRITFSKLRQLLLDMNFTEIVVPKSHIGFRHDASGTEIILPIYRPNQVVAPHHLATVRIMLDAKGLLDGVKFDQRAASASVEHSAS